MKKDAVRPFPYLVLFATFLVSLASGGVITSPLTMNIKSGEEVEYYINGTTSNVTAHGASGLPPGLECDESGYISGRVNYTNTSGSPAIYYSGIYQDGDDSSSDTLVWTVTPILQATANPSISPGAVQHIGQAMTLTRDGSAGYGVAWCETVVTRPDGSRVVTAYSGLGSSTYTLDGGMGYYTYTLKVADSTGAALVSEPIFFYGGQITPSAFSPASPKVGQIVAFTFSSMPVFSAASVATNPALDRVVSSNAWSGFATAQVQPLVRDNGQHWIWMSARSGNWWGSGVFLPVLKATPIQQAPAITVEGGASGYRTLVAGDLYAKITNPYDSTLQYSGLTQVQFRFAFSNVALDLGVQLPNGRHFVDADFLGNNDYNPATARGYVTVSGPTMPTNLQAQVTGPSNVELRWTGWAAGATAFAIYRDGVYIGSYTSGTASVPFIDNTATPGAIITYSVKMIDSVGRYSTAASVVVNAFEVFSPGI